MTNKYFNGKSLLPHLKLLRDSLRIDRRSFIVNSILRDNEVYNKEQRDYLLKVLNEGSEISSDVIGDANKKKVEFYLTKYGKMTRLEDLLKVAGLGPISLRKLCDKLLQARQINLTKPIDNSSTVLRSFITPQLSDEQISGLGEICSVQVGVETLSWCLMDCTKREVLNWNVTDLPTNYKKTSLLTLVNKVKELISGLPKADIYLLDDVSWNNSTSSQSSFGLLTYRAQLTAVLVTILSGINELSESRVVLMKCGLGARLYKKVVGGERVSVQEEVFKKINCGNNNGETDNENERDEEGAKGFALASHLRHPFSMAYTSLQKEALAEATLLAVTFVELYILKKSQLIAQLPRRKLKKAAT